MKAPTAADRCNARVRRLAQVKFVGLPAEHTPPSATTRGTAAAALALLRASVIRVIGRLEAARP